MGYPRTGLRRIPDTFDSVNNPPLCRKVGKILLLPAFAKASVGIIRPIRVSLRFFHGFSDGRENGTRPSSVGKPQSKSLQPARWTFRELPQAGRVTNGQSCLLGTTPSLDLRFPPDGGIQVLMLFKVDQANHFVVGGVFGTHSVAMLSKSLRNIAGLPNIETLVSAKENVDPKTPFDRLRAFDFGERSIIGVVHLSCRMACHERRAGRPEVEWLANHY